jgi:hypothetical protein
MYVLPSDDQEGEDEDEGMDGNSDSFVYVRECLV